MSVVISYYNDRFAIILIDRMVTSGFGHWEEQKIYDIHSTASYGFCAGVGLADGIYAVRDLLSLNPPIDFNDTDSITSFLKSTTNCKDSVFESHTSFSVGTFCEYEDPAQYKTKIFTYSVRGDGTNIYINRTLTPKNEFHILYPSTYLDNRDIYNKFIFENNLSGDDSWSAEKVFQRAKELFLIIQKDSSEVVSENGNVGIMRFNQRLSNFKSTILSF